MSNTINNGGPAFPLPAVSHQGCIMALTEGPALGMTLRDYFAAKALPVAWEAYNNGYVTYDAEDVTSGITEHAYQMADAMLLARGEA